MDPERAMNQGIEYRYLDLMKKTLAFTLWPEPPIPIETFNQERTPLKRTLVSAVSRILQSRNLRLMKEPGISTEDKEAGRIWPGHADTMIGLKRLDNLQSCVESVLQENVPGDLIETGVWRGGACIFMRAVLAAWAVEDRKVYVADSFEGLPKPDADKYPADQGDTHHTHSFLAVSQAEVENNFRRFSLLDDQVGFLKGWFKDSLPNAPLEKLAILRLDGDMYGSTMDALTHLYSKLSPGGFCIIDDYALDGCKQAVDGFRAEHRIQGEMQEVDWACRYWRKVS